MLFTSVDGRRILGPLIAMRYAASTLTLRRAAILTKVAMPGSHLTMAQRHLQARRLALRPLPRPAVVSGLATSFSTPARPSRMGPLNHN